MCAFSCTFLCVHGFFTLHKPTDMLIYLFVYICILLEIFFLGKGLFLLPWVLFPFHVHLVD